MRLQIQHLRKVYQDGNVALDDFNLELDAGVFGLLGPNGAGKSTLLEILALALMPTKGVVYWEGKNIQQHPRAFRRVLGYLPQSYGFYGELSAMQFLDYMSRLHGLGRAMRRRRVEECLELVNLTDVRKEKLKGYSGGMRQRLAIAQALIHSPELLVIDEPTTGLDPGERVAFRNLLFDLGQQCIVFLSTHIVKDVEFSCQGMTMLYGGVQQFTGRPAEFIGRVEGRVFEVDLPMAEFEAFSRRRQVIAIHEHGGRVVTRFIEEEARTEVRGAAPAAPNLEDAYVDYIRGRQEVDLAEAE